MEKVQQIYYKLSKTKRENVLWSALDYMEQYNGRTKWECIALALNIEL
jgi:hypothetical protein